MIRVYAYSGLALIFTVPFLVLFMWATTPADPTVLSFSIPDIEIASFGSTFWGDTMTEADLRLIGCSREAVIRGLTEMGLTTLPKNEQWESEGYAILTIANGQHPFHRLSIDKYGQVQIQRNLKSTITDPQLRRFAELLYANPH